MIIGGVDYPEKIERRIYGRSFPDLHYQDTKTLSQQYAVMM
jgi:hypothetical protein